MKTPHRYIPLLSLLVAIGIASPFFYTLAQETQDTSTSTAITTSTSTETVTTPYEVTSSEKLRGEGQASGSKQSGAYESARLISIQRDTDGDSQSGTQKETYLLEIRSGELKGKQVAISSDIDANPYRIQAREGDKLVVFIQKDANGNTEIYLEGFDRRNAIMCLVALFVLLLVLLSGWQGMKVAFSITVSLAVIGWVLIPAFLRGINPVPVAILLSAILTLFSSGLSFGWNKKTVITTIGTLAGTLFAFFISSIFAHWGHLSGLATEDDRLFFSENPMLNPHGLLFAGIIIAAMGIIEDVAVSIASGVEQVGRANPSTSFKSLFMAGMIIGKDHTAAMANTLIFAYVGASLSTLLLYTQYDANWLKFLNFESVSVEIVQALGATIGLMLTVPVSALLSAWLYADKHRRGLIKVK